MAGSTGVAVGTLTPRVLGCSKAYTPGEAHMGRFRGFFEKCKGVHSTFRFLGCFGVF